MFGKPFGKKKPGTSVLVTARLNDRVMPLDRGDLYEDPLQETLEKLGIGEVTGVGTQLGKDNEIEFCDIEIRLHDAGEKSLDAVRSLLEERGAPKGSKLIVDPAGREIPFGKNEGLAVYLNGTTLPDEVYQECDSNFVYQELGRLLGTEGSVHSHWQGPTETGLYLYGRSFETMKRLLSEFLSTYPLCQKARVVQIA